MYYSYKKTRNQTQKLKKIYAITLSIKANADIYKILTSVVAENFKVNTIYLNGWFYLN